MHPLLLFIAFSFEAGALTLAKRDWNLGDVEIIVLPVDQEDYHNSILSAAKTGTSTGSSSTSITSSTRVTGSLIPMILTVDPETAVENTSSIQTSWQQEASNITQSISKPTNGVYTTSLSEALVSKTTETEAFKTQSEESLTLSTFPTHSSGGSTQLGSSINAEKTRGPAENVKPDTSLAVEVGSATSVYLGTVSANTTDHSTIIQAEGLSTSTKSLVSVISDYPITTTIPGTLSSYSFGTLLSTQTTSSSSDLTTTSTSTSRASIGNSPFLNSTISTT